MFAAVYNKIKPAPLGLGENSGIEQVSSMHKALSSLPSMTMATLCALSREPLDVILDFPVFLGLSLYFCNNSKIIITHFNYYSHLKLEFIETMFIFGFIANTIS